MPKKEIFDIAVEVLHTTPKAWLVTDGTKKDWFPKSQCECEKDDRTGQYTLTAPVWLLKEKGFV